MTLDPERLAFSPAVREALAQGLPVVALESTIITHGMPHPANLETAMMAEQAVRDAGATPATIALMDGKVCVGLHGHQLERLAREAGAARKCSLRDLAAVLDARRSGGTTVAATLHIARAAGIDVFATGGIGGVHRGAGETLDISADLPALARNPLAVVCAGPKAILDLGLTLEYLETHGVPVLGYRTEELPAFWCRTSGHAVDDVVDSPGAVARVLRVHRDLGLEAALLVCNPVAEDHALSLGVVEAHIDEAVAAARREGVTGKALTPYLLSRVVEASGGESLETNQALMTANARLAAEVAVALASEAPGSD